MKTVAQILQETRQIRAEADAHLGQVRVNPADHETAKKILDTWKAKQVGKISMADIFRAGIGVFEEKLQGA